jgi:isopentenyl diphosphate isomerase/L-lactate dehydrogenase-like FMN-dependent dehydrogenase
MTDQPFANYQYEVYLQGLADQVPELPFTYAEWERRARETLDDGPYGYVAGGAGSEDTVRANLEAFRRWRIVPRMLRDVRERTTRTELLGLDLEAPVLLAPIGVQRIVHEEGELASARAAAALGVPVVLSTASSTPMEDVAEAMGDAPRWYQLYWPNDDALAASFVQRAEAAGYGAIVVTLDTFMLAWRPRDLAGAYLPFLRGVGTQQYFSDPVFRGGLEKAPDEDLQAAVLHWVAAYADPGTTWDRLAFLRDQTSLPIVLKGINHPADARLAVEHGVDAIVVSNHGGRQVDGAIGALDALPRVADEIEGAIPILFDSGIRGGADIAKALALGARAVLIGRPFVWGLAVAGEAGVLHVLRSLLAELDLTLALSGCQSPRDLVVEREG